MNNSLIKLHLHQKELIKKLSLSKKLRFKEMLLDGLESEHMNYHLKGLINLGLIEKDGIFYTLTNQGKDYSNLMNDEVTFIEKQPKTSVLLHIVRKNKSGEVENLVSRRLRQPYYGKVCRLTGKVRFGERFEEAAKRELFEETGLKAETVVLEGIHHHLRYDKAGKHIQDTIFYKFFITNTYGRFIQRTSQQENLWLTVKEQQNNTDYDFIEGYQVSTRTKPQDFSFDESVNEAQGY